MSSKHKWTVVAVAWFSLIVPQLILGGGVDAEESDQPVSALVAIPREGAAGQSRFSQPIKVALIDMAKVFKEYREFERRREVLKGEIAISENLARALAEQIKGSQTQLQKLSKNSDEYVEQQDSETCERI